MDPFQGSIGLKGIDIGRGPIDLGISIGSEIKDPDVLSIEIRQWKLKILAQRTRL